VKRLWKIVKEDAKFEGWSGEEGVIVLMRLHCPYHAMGAIDEG
jgi:hypothetical protein